MIHYECLTFIFGYGILLKVRYWVIAITLLTTEGGWNDILPRNVVRAGEARRPSPPSRGDGRPARSGTAEESRCGLRHIKPEHGGGLRQHHRQEPRRRPCNLQGLRQVPALEK